MLSSQLTFKLGVWFTGELLNSIGARATIPHSNNYFAVSTLRAIILGIFGALTQWGQHSDPVNVYDWYLQGKTSSEVFIPLLFVTGVLVSLSQTSASNLCIQWPGTWAYHLWLYMDTAFISANSHLALAIHRSVEIDSLRYGPWFFSVEIYKCDLWWITAFAVRNEEVSKSWHWNPQCDKPSNKARCFIQIYYNAMHSAFDMPIAE